MWQKGFEEQSAMDATAHDPTRQLEALVVGTGFGGLHMLNKLRNELAIKAVAIDKTAA